MDGLAHLEIVRQIQQQSILSSSLHMLSPFDEGTVKILYIQEHVFHVLCTCICQEKGVVVSLWSKSLLKLFVYVSV